MSEDFEWGSNPETQAIRAGLDAGLDGQAAAELAKLKGQFYGPRAIFHAAKHLANVPASQIATTVEAKTRDDHKFRSLTLADSIAAKATAKADSQAKLRRTAYGPVAIPPQPTEVAGLPSIPDLTLEWARRNHNTMANYGVNTIGSLRGTGGKS